MASRPKTPRRRWSIAEKRRIVAEATQPGAVKIVVARRHGISQSRLYAWRKALGNQTLTHFLPVIADHSVPSKDDGSTGSIDIILSNGHRLIVSSAIDPAHVERLLRVLAST